MAILSWVNLNSGFWDSITNWLNNNAPGSGTGADDVVIDVTGNIITTHRQGTTNINSLTSAEAFTLSGGTLTANNIDVNNTFTLSGGTLRNATIDLTGGTLQFVGGFGNVLDAVTINGDLNVTNSTVTLTNNSVFTGGTANINGATLIVNTANSLNSKTVTLTNQSLLSIGQTQTINGSTFNFNRGSLQIAGANSVVTLGAGSQMNFTGAALSISSASNSGNSHFVNAGTLRFASGTGGSAPTIGTVLFTNQGTLDANTSAVLAIGNTSTTWTNTGTINVNTINNTSASSVTFAGNWDNNGTVNLGNNGTLNLGGTFDTDDIGAIARTGTNTVQITGALNNANATLALTFSTGDYTLAGGTITGGTISQNGAALRFGNGTSTLNGVALQGDFVSNGQDVRLNNASVTGNVAINAGQTSFATATNLDGRTISATNQSILSFGQSQIINNSTINLSVGAALQLANPNNTLTLGSQTQLNLTNANTSVRPAFTGAAGSRLINNGTITVIGGSGGSNPPNISTAFFANNGRVQAYSAGILNLGTTNTVWSNEGTIDINLINNTSTSTVRFLGDWDNNGTVNLGNNAALELGGTFNTADIGIANITRTGTNTISITGVLDNTGATFALNSSTGNYTLNGGTIRGGTLTQTGDAGLRYTSNANNRLDGVTVAGDLTVSAGSVELINGASFTGGANVSSGTLFINTVTNLNNKTLNATAQSTLAIGQSQTIDNSVINISGGSSLQVNNPNTQLVLGPQTQVNVSGANSNLRQAFSGANGASLVNQGTITFSGAGGQGVSVLPFNNQGTVRVQNGSTTQISNLTNFAGGTLTGGTYEVGANSRLFLLGANIVNNAANLIFDGANSNLLSAVGTPPGPDVSALAGFAANLAAGDVTIRNGRNLSTAGNLSNAGDFTVGANSTLTVGGNYLQTGGSTVLRGGTLTATGGTVNLQNGNFSGFGTINGTVLDSGVLAADALTGDININGNYDQANDSVLNLEIGGLNEGQFDQLNITGTADLEGVLNVSFVNGFESSLKVGDAFELLTFNGYTGNFSAINLPTLANPDLRLVSILQNNRLLLTVLDNRNNIPVAVADTLNTTEGATFSGTVADALLRNDIDLDGDALTVTGIDTSTTQGIVTLLGNQLTYNPNGKFESLGAGETATDTFSYTITDGRQGTATATVSVVITGQNDAPIATDDAVSTLRNTPITISAATLLGNDRDIDANDVLSITGVGNATNGTVALNANGDIVFTPTTGFNGNATFTYTVSDGKGGSDTGSVAVTVNAPLNVPPVAGNDAITANEDNSLTVAANVLLANDTDANGDALTISAVNGSTAQGLVSLNPNGSITYNPNGKFESLAAGETATDTFSYTVSDGNGGTSTATVTVTINGVNDAPVAVNRTATTNENTATTINVLSSATDVDASDILTVSAVNTTNTRGSVTINPDGTLNYNPNGQFESLGQGASATDSFSYTISDGKGGTSNATVTVTITGLNDAPVAVNDAASTSKNTALTLTAASLLANDRDVDAGDILSLTSVGNAVNGTVALDSNGNVVFTPTAGFVGTGSFSYAIADGKNGTANATVTVTISDVPNRPPVAVLDTAFTNENTAVAINVLANDTDADGDTLTVNRLDTTGTRGSVTINPNGTLNYNPNGQFESLAAGETATDTFSYTVSDGNGGTSTATVTVTINGVNDAPVAVSRTATTNENTATTINVLSSATDVDASDILTVSAVNTTNTRGSVTINPDGTLNYNPNGQFESLGQGASATDSFSYTISDGKGGTSNATVNVTITGLNDAPVAVNDQVSTNKDAVLTLTAAALLGNDRDIDSGDILSLIGVGNAVNGAVTINDSGNVVFTPGAGFTGNASFSYTIADQAGVTSTANVSVVVNPDQGEVLSGLGGRKRFTIPRGSGTTTIANFGGVGRGDRPSPAVIAEADTLVFQGADLIARNLLLDQVGSDLQLTFEGVPNTTVVLKDFALENLDNLRTSNGASVNLANIFFNGDTSIRDSFDVFDANSTRTSVFRTNTVTFLNDLNNVVRGFDGADVINGQGGNDTLYGLEGNDLLRGGIGNDLLYGDAGNDRLVGGLGADQFVFRTGEPFEAGDLGIDTIVDFNGAEGDKIALRRRTFASLSSPVGNGLNANDFAVINAPTNGSAGNLAARIIYNQGTGDLIYNQNGAASGLGSGGRFATLTASPTLTANDFRIFA